MEHWKRSEIVTLLSSLPCEIEVTPPGGDWDIEGLYLTIKGVDDGISITPFVSPKSGGATFMDDVGVYAVEVRNNHSDSHGGCQTDNEDLGSLYGIVCARLRANGFYVIDHYNWIF